MPPFIALVIGMRIAQAYWGRLLFPWFFTAAHTPDEDDNDEHQ